MKKSQLITLVKEVLQDFYDSQGTTPVDWEKRDWKLYDENFKNGKVGDELKKYIDDYTEIDVNLLKNLLKDKKKHPNELDPRTGGNKFGYRGMTFKKDFIKKLKEIKTSNGVTEYVVPSNIKITSRSNKGFLSFTVDEEVAKGFGHYSGYVDHKKSLDRVGGYVRVSLDNPNFILHPDYTGELSKDLEYSKESERETLLIGNSFTPDRIYVVDEEIYNENTTDTGTKITVISVIDSKRNLDNDQIRQLFDDNTGGTFYIYTNEEGEYENTKPVSRQDALKYIDYYNARLKKDRDKEEEIGDELRVLGVESELQFKQGEFRTDPSVFSKNENYADGKVKGKSRPGRVKKSGASCNGSVTDLRKKAKNASGEKAKMYHWCANMKGGKK